MNTDEYKLLIEKVALATTRFIKGEITEEQREKYYDEVYNQLLLMATKSAEEERSKCWELDKHQSSEFRYHLNQLIFAINNLGEIDPTIYVREAQKALSQSKEL